MKFLVETRGAYQLIDYDSRNPTIRFAGCTVIMNTDFVQSRIADSQITIRGELTDESTDEEWLKYQAETPDDLDFAVSSFLSAFGVKPEPEVEEPKAPAPTPKSAPAKTTQNPAPNATA